MITLQRVERQRHWIHHRVHCRIHHWMGGGLLLMAVVLAACGGGPAAETGANGDEGGITDAQATATAQAGESDPRVPTMPAAGFAAPTTSLSGLSAEDATATAEAAPSEPTPTPDLARGETIYGNRDCADCHGAQGEGVADEGSALAGASLTESEFTDFMRTGGTVGRDHLYGPDQISPSGMSALYAWLASLPAPE